MRPTSPNNEGINQYNDDYGYHPEDQQDDGTEDELEDTDAISDARDKYNLNVHNKDHNKGEPELEESEHQAQDEQEDTNIVSGDEEFQVTEST
jgi:hypothetical protein